LVRLAQGTVEQATPLDGLDVWPMLTQGAPSPHDAILLVSSPTAAALRVGDWKLTVNSNQKPESETGSKTNRKKDPETRQPVMLHNLAADPGETRNLADAESERIKAMRAKLDALMKNAVQPGHLSVGE